MADRDRPDRTGPEQQGPEQRGPGQQGAGQNETPWSGTEIAERIAELEDRWLRAVADLENLRKRMLRDMERQRADERARVAAEWLPVLDHLDLALKHADAEPRAVIEGVRAIRDQAIGVLARLGFPRYDEAGVIFDHNLHDAVSAVPAAGAEPGTVIEVVRPGYGDGSRQLRPAAVVVATQTDGPRTGEHKAGGPEQEGPEAG